MNLNLGQSGWDAIFARWGLLIRVWMWMKEYVHGKLIQDRLVGSGPASLIYDDWDILVEDWNSLDGWNTYPGAGTIEIAPAGQLHIIAADNEIALIEREMMEGLPARGLIPAKGWTQKIKIFVDSFGDTSYFKIHLIDGDHELDLKCYSDKIQIMNTGASYDDFPILTSTGIWYYLWIVADDDKFRIFRSVDDLNYSLIISTPIREAASPSDWLGIEAVDLVEIHCDFLYLKTGASAPGSVLLSGSEEGPTLLAESDKSSSASAIYDFKLSGIKIGENTDPLGVLFVVATMDAGNEEVTISLYKDFPEMNLVAEGTSSGGLDSIVSLIEKNNSGISGSCYFYKAFGANASYRYALFVRPDWKRRFQQEFPTGTAEDAEILSKALSQLSDFADSINDLIDDWEDFIENEFIEKFLKIKIQSAQTSVLSISHSQTGGTVSIEYTGILRDLAEAMEDDTVAQTIRKNTATASAGVLDPDNLGNESLSAPTLYQHAHTGRVTLECIGEDFPDEYFEVRFRPDAWWEYDDLSGENYAYAEKIYKDNPIGISQLLIARGVREILDASNVYSIWVLDGETINNTDDGKIYVKFFPSVAANGLPWSGKNDVTKLYKSEASRDADAVGTNPTNVVAYGFGTGAIAINEYLLSGLSGSVTVVDPEDIATADLNMSCIEGDILTFIITKTESGIIQKYINDIYEYDLPSHADLGSETISDAFARRG